MTTTLEAPTQRTASASNEGLNSAVQPKLTPQNSDRLAMGLLVIQPSPFCNINCDYCYLPNRTDTRRMDHAVLEKVMDKVWDSGLVLSPFSLLWHAGEPLAVPISWYEKAFEIINRYPKAKDYVIHSVQTNGTLINDKWCEFLNKHEVEVGLSVDGPREIHDHHRKTRKGEGTFDKTMRGMECLKKNNVPFGVVSVISDVSVDHPDEMYDFYREHGITGIGFNIEEVEGANETSSLGKDGGLDRIRAFLKQFYLRNKADGFPLNVREFQNAERNILEPGWCSRPDGGYYNQEADPFGMVNVDCFGNFSSFSPELLGQSTEKYESFTFGNLLSGSLFDATVNGAFQHVLADIEAGNQKCSETCQFYKYCGGASPSNKYYENGTFDSTETHQCRSTVMMPMEIILEDLENDLGITETVSPLIEMPKPPGV
ncbi:MAG: GRRM system radical SAM/SPASM domain protein [Verrucomicrobiales bacterium]|nr:GRRM system radical SAM/SPASM domain protein [Verrucomicrobiales bacterium]